MLDGARSECEWKSDRRSRVAGTLPAEEMPRIRRDDYVTNSNDSYWLANPASPLEGFSPIIGPERTGRTVRTRAGLVFVREQLENGEKLTAEDMRNLLYSHRNYGADDRREPLQGRRWIRQPIGIDSGICRRAGRRKKRM